MVHADFAFSGTFAPTAIDTNRDTLPAEMIHAEVDGRLQGPGSLRLTSYTEVVEYGLQSPSDACTTCFRVNEADYSVQENAYTGPIAHLIRPIRDPATNPTSAPYSAEEWTSFYRLNSGELIYAQIVDLQICVEQGQPVPICHVKQREKIIGGTGRFKHATGEVTFTAIAPTYTADAPLITEDGCMSQRPPTFATGPIHGAGRMSLQMN